MWPTRIELRQVNLPQVIRFADQVVDESSGLTMRDLRLRSPAETPTGETWSAEITLTQLTFSPKTP